MYAHREIKKKYQVPANAVTSAVKQFFNQFANEHHRTSLPIELTNTTGTHLDHLNEDCLLEIFSRNSWTPLELCALAETCKVFKRIAQRVFPKTLTIDKDYPCPKCTKYTITSEENEPITASAQDVERIFKHFGSSLVALEVIKFNAHEMNLVAKHCGIGKLKKLKISQLKITEVVAVELKPIFRHLQTFAIDHASILCEENVFANCDSLIELNVHNISHYDPIMKNNFPKLQRFTFSEQRWHSQLISNFLKRHRALKCIRLRTRHFNAEDNFFPKLGNTCEELEELWVMAVRFSKCLKTLDFSNFHSLKRLYLNYYDDDDQRTVQLEDAILGICWPIDIKEFFEALPWLKNLRELTVYLDYIRETVQLTPLPQLTKLSLIGHRLVVGNVVDIIRQLSSLEELDISMTDVVLSEKEFYEIVKLNEERQNVLTIKCRFAFSQSTETCINICDENLKVKLIKM